MKMLDHVSHPDTIKILIRDGTKIQQSQVQLKKTLHQFEILLAIVIVSVQIQAVIFTFREHGLDPGGGMITGSDVKQFKRLITKRFLDVLELKIDDSVAAPDEVHKLAKKTKAGQFAMSRLPIFMSRLFSAHYRHRK
ncbi:MAG: hypothetical protein P4L51_29870 [Puia sp.]|nr:hypothetical protein [Puia sp.]